MTTAGLSANRSKRLLTMRSGGWVLLLAVLLCVFIVVNWLSHFPQRIHLTGDGKTVDSYGYDLSTCHMPRHLLVAAGMPKDGLPALVEPEVFTPAQAEVFAAELRKQHRGKFLVPSDRVIGVEIDGQARAYPIPILTWHEVCNDTLAGRPILVTYNPLCDSSVVFDRRVGDAAPVFGVSGLVFQSNLVFYDRGGTPTESLWSQLECRAIAGPAAGREERLEVLPAEVTHWGDWVVRHPDTTVLAPVRDRLRIYNRTYEPYFGSPALRFPVDPNAPVNGIQLKSPVLAVKVGESWLALPFKRIAEHASADGTWTYDRPPLGSPCVIHYRTAPEVAWAEDESGRPLPQMTSFWFGWYATHPPAH